jgi:hypothetical protein
VHAVQRGRRVDVPERDQRARALQVEHGALQQFVEHADAAGLDHQVGAARLLHRAQHLGLVCAE